MRVPFRPLRASGSLPSLRALRALPSIAAASLFAVITACSSDPPPASPGDAGTVPHREDAAGKDSEPSDVELGDADPSDAESRDGGGLDSATDLDAAVLDANELDGGALDSGPSDVGPSDGGPRPLPHLRACLGERHPSVLLRDLPYLEVEVGDARGNFLLDVGSNYSAIDLAAFPRPPRTGDCNPAQLGALCTVGDFTLFGLTSSVTLTLQDFSWLRGPLRQAGIIGTDFLSLRVITLLFESAEVLAGVPASFCTDEELASAGLVPLTTAGFYTNDLATLKPLTDVIPSAESFWTVPNIPTVPIEVAGVSAVAQLDTGFDDALVPFSLNINEAFLSAIIRANPRALRRDASLDLTLTTCVAGVSQNVEGYRLEPGVAFEFIDIDSRSPARFEQAVIFVKMATPEAVVCGGIGTWEVPAGQVAISFMSRLGILIFDPFSSRVWIPEATEAP